MLDCMIQSRHDHPPGVGSILLLTLLVVSAFACTSSKAGSSEASKEESSTSGEKASAQAADEPDETFALVDAKAEDVMAAIKAPGSKAVVVNLWATWCKPCVEELPYLLKLREKYKDKGMRLILVSFDFNSVRSDVVRFLKKQKIDFPSYRRKGKDNEFLAGLSDQLTGQLPTTIFYDGEGNIKEIREGEATYEVFEASLLKVLKP